MHEVLKERGLSATAGAGFLAHIQVTRRPHCHLKEASCENHPKVRVDPHAGLGNGKRPLWGTVEGLISLSSILFYPFPSIFPSCFL